MLGIWYPCLLHLAAFCVGLGKGRHLKLDEDLGPMAGDEVARVLALLACILFLYV